MTLTTLAVPARLTALSVAEGPAVSGSSTDAWCTVVTETTWTEPEAAQEAARWCRRCPEANDCLLQALRVDAAHRHGRDPIGITGVYGGVWFDPDYLPHQVGRDTGARRRRVQGNAA